MADITLTAANVRALPGAVIRRMFASDTVGIGQPVYVSGNGTVAVADGSAVATSFAIGIAVSTPDGGSDVSANEAVDVCVFGPVAGYSGMTGGELVYCSDTAGTLSNSAGDSTKDTVLGICLDDDVLLVNPQIISFS